MFSPRRRINRVTYLVGLSCIAVSIYEYKFLTIIEKGDEAFARWNCLIQGKLVKNTEYFLFDGEKIKTIEVYSGQPSK